MGRRFDRFRKLERARPDAPDADAAQPSQSMRFHKIEPPKEAASAAAPDPFAPPPDDAEIPLEIAHDDARDRDRLRAQREASAKAKLDAEAQRIAELRMREEAQQSPLSLALERKKEAALSMTRGERTYLLLGLIAATALVAAFVGPHVWGLAPVFIAIYIVSMLAERR